MSYEIVERTSENFWKFKVFKEERRSEEMKLKK